MYALNVNSFSLSNLLKMTWWIWLLKARTKTKFLSRVDGTRRGVGANATPNIPSITHTVRKWIYIRHKLPRTFGSSLSIYDINAYKKCFEKLIWTKKKNHVPQGGIEPPPSLVRSGLARIKWKMSSVLPTELSGHLYSYAPI